jgi:peptidoglycan glycosyltransferase
MVLCFSAVVIQLVNIQYVEAPALRASRDNPRSGGTAADNLRGNIYASDGTLLAQSIRTSGGSYDYTRRYPEGSLYSQIVGFDSTYEGTAGVEDEYDSYLTAHKEPAHTLSQALGLDHTPVTTDNLTLTLVPRLQMAFPHQTGQPSRSFLIVPRLLELHR